MNSARAILFLVVAYAAFVGGSPRPVHAAPGDVDTAFNPNVNNDVEALAVQPDGKVLIGGGFTTVQPNGATSPTTRNYFARLNTDGTLDTGFVPAVKGNTLATAVQPDGKIIVGGAVGTGTAATYLSRLNADGTWDSTFLPNPSSYVYALAFQPDGKIIVGGDFTTLQPNGAASATPRGRIARINADGSLDTSFNPNANGRVYSVTVQPDGKIILTGAFTTLQPNGAATATTRNSIARVNADGSLDTAYNPNPNAAPFCAALQPDGKLLIGGYFTSLQPNGAAAATTRYYLARLNTDGTLDSAFAPRMYGGVEGMALQADGKTILTGDFTAVLGTGATASTARNRVARLLADGTLDTTFNPNANMETYGVALQNDGRVLLAGIFTALQPNGAASATARNRVARLLNDAATGALTVPTTSRVQWLRGGAAPEAAFVTFELSTDGGGNWTALGNGTRITGGWELTGLNVPTSGQVRARARVTGGYETGCAGLVETVAAYAVPIPDIAVEVAGATVADGGGVFLGETALGSGATLTKSFVIRNTGFANLAVNAITAGATSGGGAFVVNSTGTSANLAAGETTTFSVTFSPSGSASGTRAAALQITTNVSGSKNPYDLALSALALSTTLDSDGDGLNDHSEYQLAALGFDWQVNQSALVQTYYAGANGAGLYTASQVQALYVGAPLLQKDGATGQFKLTITVQQSADLQTFAPLSLASGSTTINSAGALEFRFNSSTGAAFYRLQSQ